MFKVLITGFEPYRDYLENSSWAVAEKITTSVIDGVDIASEQLPVSFKRVASSLHKAIAKHNPNLILLLGQSGGSDKVKLERVALNMMDSKLSDNDGYTPDEEPISNDSPSALFTTEPLMSIRMISLL